VADSEPCRLGQVKGNRSSRIYHVPGGASYPRTVTNVQCFDTEDQALAAGYRKARN
jgi:methylphosphotriester-DNA--protein-cysteine methyltransferase